MKWTPPRQLDLRERFGTGWLGELYHVPGDGNPPSLVRVLSPELRNREDEVLALLEQSAALHHPHLLPVTAPARSGDDLLYAMPLAQGGSLRTLLREGTRPPPATVLGLAEQVGEGLAFLHSQGLTHGNLTPENVLLSAPPAEGEGAGLEWHAQLSDAGLGSLRPADQTSPYLSPRQREGQGSSLQGDLYSLGALLYEGLTGRRLPLHPGLEDLRALPHGLRNLVGRTLGLLPTFADLPAFLRELRALPPSVHGPRAAPSPLTVELSAEQGELTLTPGEAQTLRLTVQSSEALVLSLVLQGWPESWAEAPPTLSLAAGTPTTVALTLLVPRFYAASPKTYEAEVLALRGEAAHSAGDERLAHLPLRLEVLPFSAGTLELLPASEVVGTAAPLRVQLSNEGNQGQVYHLAVSLPPGSALQGGTLHRQFELPPGGEYREILDVHLPPAWLRGAERSFTAVAHSLVPGSEAAWPPSRATLEASTWVQQRPLLPWWAALLLAGALAGGSVWAARPPQISEFRVIGPAPVRGEAFTLGWKASGARQVQIVELPQERLNTQGRVQVPGVAAEKTYTLVASGLFSERREQITVTPTPPTPRIVSLTATPGQALYGESVQVQWEVAYTPQAQLTPFGPVPLRGSREVTMTRDRTFTLDANPPGRDSAQLRSRITVTLRPPVIEEFSVTPARVKRGESVTVRWRVAGAKQVRLAPLGTLPASGTRTLRPREDADYVLKASNGQQESTQSAAVTVAAPPVRIEAFTVVPERPTIGQPLKVFWRTAHAQSVELRWGDQRQVLPSQGQLSLVATAQMGTMNLVARPDEGEAALETRRLALVTPPPRVTAAPPSPTPAAEPAPARPAPVAPGRDSATGRSTPPTAPVTRAPETPAPRPAPAAPPKPATPPTPAAAETGSGAQTTAPRPATTLSPTPARPQTPPAAPVRILGFRSVTAAPRAGQPLTLRWQVSGDSQVLLRGENGRLLGRYPARGSATLTPQRPGRTTFVLSSVRNPDRRAALSVQVAAPPSVPPARPAPTPAQEAPPTVQISEFRAAPAVLSPGQAPTLVWRVSGVKKVYLAGLTGPNVDGSFPPVGSVTGPRTSQSRTFVLRAGDVRRSLRVTVLAARPSTDFNAPSPSIPARPATRATGARYAFLEGPWSHSFGRLSLDVSGNRVSGSLQSNSALMPSGSVRGTLSGDVGAPTLSGFLSTGDAERAIVLRFDPQENSFEGVYAGEGRRQRWCGWRGAGKPEGC